MASKGQKFRRYSPELKKNVVEQYLAGETDILALAYKNGIASQGSIKQWIKSYEKNGEVAFVDKRGIATSETAPLKGRPRKRFETKEEKDKYLELVKESNRKKAAKKRHLTYLRKKREQSSSNIDFSDDETI